MDLVYKSGAAAFQISNLLAMIIFSYYSQCNSNIITAVTTWKPDACRFLSSHDLIECCSSSIRNTGLHHWNYFLEFTAFYSFTWPIQSHIKSWNVKMSHLRRTKNSASRVINVLLLLNQPNDQLMGTLFYEDIWMKTVLHKALILTAFLIRIDTILSEIGTLWQPKVITTLRSFWNLVVFMQINC